MATVTIKPVEPVERTVLLELTESEAVTLVLLSRHISGSLTGSRRRDTDAIGQELCMAVDRHSFEIETTYGDITRGSVNFSDEAL